MSDAVHRRVHVVINPASGKDEPILNVLNDVFREHGVAWDVSVTHRYGDAGDQARAAIADGVDLVVALRRRWHAARGRQRRRHRRGRHGATDADGRSCRVARATASRVRSAFPRSVRDATVLLCTSTRTRGIDVGRLRSVGQAQVDDRYFIQRLYIGIEPEEQTSRELKDRYGVFAYAVSAAGRVSGPREFQYHVDIDGEVLEFLASKVYMVNSGMTGSGLKVAHGYAIDDGLLDCFVLDKANLDTFSRRPRGPWICTRRQPRRYYRQARADQRDGRAGPACLGGRRVHRSHAALGRRAPGCPDGCRPLRVRRTSVYSTGASTGSIRPSASRYERLLGHIWFSQVTPILWLGGAPTYGRDSASSCGSASAPSWTCVPSARRMPDFFDEHDIAHRQYRVPDVTVPDEDVLTDAVDWIAARIGEGRVVLIHCAKGRGRSATVLAAYLMDAQGMTFDEVDDLLTGKRPLVKLQDRHRQVLESWMARRLAARPSGDADSPSQTGG